MKTATFNRAIWQAILRGTLAGCLLAGLAVIGPTAAVAGGGTHGGHGVGVGRSTCANRGGLSLLGSSVGGGLGLGLHDNPNLCGNFGGGNFSGGNFGCNGFRGSCCGSGFGGYGGGGWACGGGILDDGRNDIPYFSLHPPVYYSYPIARTYGYSPFAYPPYVITPPVADDTGPAEIINPYVPPADDKAPANKSPGDKTPVKPAPRVKAAGAKTAQTADTFGGSDKSMTIVNPFVTAEVASDASK